MQAAPENQVWGAGSLTRALRSLCCAVIPVVHSASAILQPHSVSIRIEASLASHCRAEGAYRSKLAAALALAAIPLSSTSLQCLTQQGVRELTPATPGLSAAASGATARAALPTALAVEHEEFLQHPHGGGPDRDAAHPHGRARESQTPRCCGGGFYHQGVRVLHFCPDKWRVAM